MMTWEPDVGRGAWLAGPFEDVWPVPRGFDAAVAALHPADEDGTRERGRLDVELLAGVARHLAAHTSTPQDGVAAIWEGWGGLVSASGRAPLVDPGRVGFFAGIAGGLSERWRRRGEPAPDPGILPPEVAAGPRFRLPPGGDYILFRAGAKRFVDPRWVDDAPWLDAVGRHSPETPSLLWPDDHAWVLVTDTEADRTVVAGSRALVDALTRDKTIETAPAHW
ncbi:hypothetical protein [Oerskovia flava]|uniref:hypothetical protein n=1 Tax=Oerskovia flava TaxID=2986422 RepID=UPI00224070A2|nr:hypothetical protein [Oerskovia sp. JB1-3-2]